MQKHHISVHRVHSNFSFSTVSGRKRPILRSAAYMTEVCMPTAKRSRSRLRWGSRMGRARWIPGQFYLSWFPIYGAGQEGEDQVGALSRQTILVSGNFQVTWNEIFNASWNGWWLIAWGRRHSLSVWISEKTQDGMGIAEACGSNMGFHFNDSLHRRSFDHILKNKKHI